MSNNKVERQLENQFENNEQFRKLVSNAVFDGWTVKLLNNGKLEMTKPKTKLKQEVTFNGNKYVSKLLK